jgi:hypothetical protein
MATMPQPGAAGGEPDRGAPISFRFRPGRPGGERGKYVPEAEWERAQEGHRMVVEVLHGWGQRKANDMGWPMF